MQYHLKKYYRKVIFIMLLLVSAIQAKAQDSTKLHKQDSAKVYKNNINLELFGKGLLYSIQYERVIWIKNKSQLLVSIGANPYMKYSLLGTIVSVFSTVTIPTFSVNYTYGGRWKFFVSEGFSFTIPIDNFELILFHNAPPVHSKTFGHEYIWFNSIGVAHNYSKRFFMRLYGSLIYKYNKYGTYFYPPNLSALKEYQPFFGIDFGYKF